MTTTTTEIPADWDTEEPSTWTLTTTVDAHKGYHGPTGMVERGYETITTSAADYEPTSFIEPGRDSAEWWADVLTTLHDAQIAVAEASPEQIEAARVALGVEADPEATVWDYADDSDDLETSAARAREIIAALKGGGA